VDQFVGSVVHHGAFLDRGDRPGPILLLSRIDASFRAEKKRLWSALDVST
jgi:hypothetical protein